MPEGRMLKKVISESKSLGNLRSDSARLLYTWLIPFLDIEGRHSADPEIIKGHIFPKVKTMSVAKISALLADLSVAGLIILYRNNGETYLQFTKFKEHQSLKADREAPSKIPPPKAENIVTHENSGVGPENSPLSKVKISKDKLNTLAEKPGPLFEREFSEFWQAYPREGRLAKQEAQKRFVAICKRGELPKLVRGVNGYNDFLKHQRLDNNFDQRPMYAKTFLNGRWEEFAEYEFKPSM